MSLPLTRRIARAALLVAAGAAPVVGAAGSAGAMELPQAPVGGLSALDTDNVSGTVDSVSRETTKVAGQVGGKTAEKAAPGATKTVGKAAKATTPLAKKATGDTAGQAGSLVGGATKGGLPTDALTGGGLPTSSLGGMPLGG
ncbi:ATP-binding protein [Streptomyces peucetius]|uniref:ATP-binding protein n=1 Tax=Streptomyces peucetius TaxID=1950 RepID=A0ABY6IE58_STRPE|nr:ATP-binding protein [Streptomyces peucetius]UYQ64222.1 ATP-binding protein [Streptomyces peucetius]